MRKIMLALFGIGLVFSVAPKYFTSTELAPFNGQAGSPAYVAVAGMVYDVTSANGWVKGGCKGYLSGQDITGFSELSANIKNVVKKQPVVGRYVNRMTKRQVSYHNGKKGKPASIIYNGLIYDVSGVRSLRPFSGQDLSSRNIDVTTLKVIGKAI